MLPTAIDLLTLLLDCKAAGPEHILREMLSLLKQYVPAISITLRAVSLRHAPLCVFVCVSTVPTEQILAAVAGYGTIKDINATILLV